LKERETVQGKPRVWSLVFAIALPCVAAAAPAIPPGSYRQSCRNIKVDATKLSLIADCDPKDKGKFWEGTQPLDNYFYCVGDIWNDDGYLRCNKPVNSPKMVAARKAIAAGIESAFGRKAEASETVGWIRKMFSSGMDQTFEKGWTPLQARIFFNQYVARPENGELRTKIIKQAFHTVYGMETPAERQAFWDAKLKDGGDAYTRVVADELSRMNASSIARKMTVLRVYKDTMGRPPTADESAYWTARTEHYQGMVDAARNWLYSPQGAKDLTETVRRALQDKYAQPSVSEQAVKDAMEKYAKTRKIFDEM
jgi:hypothetical protein